MAKVAALLLAAGESTRMGELKALLPWAGKTLLEHQVDALTSAGLSPIIVVLGHEADRLLPLLSPKQAVQCVRNPDYRQGKTTSLNAGLRTLQGTWTDTASPEEDAVLVLNVDQPRSLETIRRVLDLHVSGSQTTLITIPTYGGKGGHPLVLSTYLLRELMEVSEESLGLLAVVRRHEGETHRAELGTPEVLLDLNTTEDYQKALDTFGSN